ncbi:PstS family phosphate ABC transporter substrate-binding protein [Halomonas sp. V046]|uniref:PstS family phosphate ABC transporter substrate-binding protein n=1 Tax=Halomonas sp. V046 TaxID=3459611 RepID=UPI004043EBAC
MGLLDRLRTMLLTSLLLIAAPASADSVVGNLNAVGSDTMAELMLRWGEHLEQRWPGIRLQLQASGSASAPPALIAGTTLLGPMSRPMLDDERRGFSRRYGYQPTALVVGQDALAVVVHRRNPLTELSRTQLDAIFSDTRRCGADAGISRWQMLGLAWPEGPIHLYGRNAVSGTHALFRRLALCDGEFRVSVNASPGSAAVVAQVGEDPRGIGYAGLNHLTSDVRTLAIGDPGQAVSPSRQTLRSGRYPMARDLLLYVNHSPDKALPAAERAFLDLVLSPTGQAVVAELGFVGLPVPVLNRQRRAVGLDPLGAGFIAPVPSPVENRENVSP